MTIWDSVKTKLYKKKENLKVDDNAIVFWKFLNLQCVYYDTVQGLSIAMLSD